MEDELLTIGRFARLCRVGAGRLREYEELGLVQPVRVDADSGYRYYARSQARDVLTAELLLDAGVPLAVVADVLRGDERTRTVVLQAERERLAERADRDTGRIGVLTRLAQGGLPDHEVVREHEPERRLAAVHLECGPGGLGECTEEGVRRLLGAIEAAGTPWIPPLIGLLPLDLAEGMRVGIAAETEEDEVPRGAERAVLPAADVASTMHEGPCAHLPLAYNALFTWIHDQGLQPHGPARETYLATPGETDPDEQLTRIAVPIEPRRAGDGEAGDAET
ncbi:MerR family transcriptional regulator [Nocardiopsis sp. CNT-189]|uniref:MerR family transcriptional regulator n=1 Tax=Nocardiopsis oceanisediminis TaxID=2816862 RepID=UPI003B2ABEFF